MLVVSTSTQSPGFGTGVGVGLLFDGLIVGGGSFIAFCVIFIERGTPSGKLIPAGAREPSSPAAFLVNAEYISAPGAVVEKHPCTEYRVLLKYPSPENSRQA